MISTQQSQESYRFVSYGQSLYAQFMDINGASGTFLRDRLYDMHEQCYPFMMEPDANRFLGKFIHIEDVQSVNYLQVAEAFQHCFGDIIVCRSLSKERDEIITIMDYISEMLEYYDDTLLEPHILGLMTAFAHIGFKNREWYSNRILLEIYTMHPDFQNEDLNIAMDLSSEFSIDSDSDYNADHESDAESDHENECMVVPI